MTQGNTVIRRNRRFHKASRGFSLIETMVVLIVLLIGIFALVRLFPGGFLTIQRTSELSNAQAIANQQLEVERGVLSVPESIVSATIDGNNNVTINPNVAPDILRDYSKDDVGLPPNTTDPYYVSNINNIRYVIGETFRVPVATNITASVSKVTAPGSLYMLQNGPVFNQFVPDSSNQDSVSVYGTSLQRIEQSAAKPSGQYDDNVVLQNDNQYAIDYDKLLIGFFPRRTSVKGSRVYRVSYDYYDQGPTGNPVLHTVLDATFTLPDDPNLPAGTNEVKWLPLFNTTSNPSPTSLPLPTLASGHKLVGLRRGSEDISRRFTLVTTTPVDSTNGTAPAWTTDDAYEYAWFSDQVSSNSNIGILIFNPLGHTVMVPTANGSQPLTARVNYMAYDNHILREQRSLSSQAPYSLKLTLPFVRTNGDTLDDQSTYNGMFRESGETADLLIYNANNGQKLVELRNGTPTTDSLLQSVVLDARNGIVLFPPIQNGLNAGKYEIDVQGLQNASLKIFYMAQKDWGQQLQKAHSHYLQADTPASVDYHSYLVGDGTNGSRLTRVYFPLSEAGKSVVVGEYWTNTMTGTGTPGTSPTRYANQIFQVSPSTQTDTITGFGPMVYIDLNDGTTSAPRMLDPTQTGRAVSNIHGVSLKARVIWANSATVSQDPNGNNVLRVRWREVDQDTFLNPAPGY